MPHTPPPTTIHISLPFSPSADPAPKAAPASFPHEPILDAIYDATFITGPDGVILDCNWRAIDFFRAPPSDSLHGHYIHTLFTCNPSRMMTEVGARLQDHPFLVLECRAKRFDNTSFVAETAVSRSLPGKGHYLFCVRDITLRTESKQRLEEAVERLRKNDRDRMEFVSNVSHELRTPLTSMIYAVNNMLRGVAGPLPDKAIAYLERLQIDAQRLMTTVNDILDLRQIENHTLTLTLTTVPLNTLIQTVVDVLRIQAEAKSITLTRHETPREYFTGADRQKLERVFFNIIANAVKFTPEGGAVAITTGLDPENPTRIRVTVDDNGIGIPPEALPQVARRYFRVGDHIAGTGLGLAIVREIIDLHGGAMTIQSPVPGATAGTRIDLRLPAAEPPQVYIASTDPARLQTLADLASSLGFGTRPDPDCRMILRNCLQSPPALLLLDASTLAASAGEIALQIRDQPHLAKLPVLLLTPPDQDTRLADLARLRITLIPAEAPRRQHVDALKKLLLQS